MIIVQIKEGDTIDKALKKLKRKFEKTGIAREVRNRKHFVKPSVRRREVVSRAIYLQKLKEQKMNG